MDSSVSETYGQQEGTAYNGHFECTCYHPLFVQKNAGLRRKSLRTTGTKPGQGVKRGVNPTTGTQKLGPPERSMRKIPMR